MSLYSTEDSGFRTSGFVQVDEAANSVAQSVEVRQGHFRHWPRKLSDFFPIAMGNNDAGDVLLEIRNKFAVEIDSSFLLISDRGVLKRGLAMLTS